MHINVLKQRGFTLIELLVVIAIIGILASVVLASLNTARDRGEDASIEANLSGVRTQAELIYGEDGDYDGVCGDSTVTRAVSDSGGTCTDDADEWAASAQLSDDDYFCVDYTGEATTTGSAHGTTDGSINC